ncbi:MAG TPA: efflux RND transporter periplasmic adaptor subunit [Rhodocyclaceae bacterium]
MPIQRTLSAIALCLLLAACAETPPPPAPAKIVRSLVAGSAEAAGERRYSGDVHARYETVLAFRLNGKLTQRLVDAGTVVKAGQPLARLDAADAALQATQADAQRALAEAEVKRYRDLRAKNFISQSALDAKETAFRAADAQFGLARNQSAYTTLTADRAGVVAAVLAEAGQVVAAGQPVLRLAPDGEREVAIAIPESDVAAYKVGDAAEVTLWANEAKPLKGRLRELAAAADPATRTYAARVTLPEADARLAIGMTATVKFSAKAGAGDLTVPLAAIFQQGDKPALWLIGKDNVLVLRPISVARYSDGGAVVGEGLQAGERFVAAGVHKLVAGEKVRLAEAPAPATTVANAAN